MSPEYEAAMEITAELRELRAEVEEKLTAIADSAGLLSGTVCATLDRNLDPRTVVAGRILQAVLTGQSGTFVNHVLFDDEAPSKLIAAVWRLATLHTAFGDGLAGAEAVRGGRKLSADEIAALVADIEAFDAVDLGNLWPDGPPPATDHRE